MASPEEDYTHYYILTHPNFVPGVVQGLNTTMLPWKHLTLIKSKGSDSTSGGGWVQSFLTSIGELDAFKMYSAAYKFHKKVDKFPPILFFKALSGEEPLPGIFSSVLKGMIKFSIPPCLIPVKTGLQMAWAGPGVSLISQVLLTKGEKGALSKFKSSGGTGASWLGSFIPAARLEEDEVHISEDFPLSQLKDKVSVSTGLVALRYAPNDLMYNYIPSALSNALNPPLGTFHHVPAATAGHKAVLGLPIASEKDPICEIIGYTDTTVPLSGGESAITTSFMGLKVACNSPVLGFSPYWFQLLPAKVDFPKADEKKLLRRIDKMVNIKLNEILFDRKDEYVPVGLKKPISSFKGTLGLVIQNQIKKRFPTVDTADPSLCVYLTSPPAGPVGQDRFIGELVLDKALLEKDDHGNNVVVLDPLADTNLPVKLLAKTLVKVIAEAGTDRPPIRPPEELIMSGHDPKGDRLIEYQCQELPNEAPLLDIFIYPKLSLFIFQDESYLTTRIQETQLTLEDSPTWETVHELNRLLTKRWFSDL